MNGTEIVQFLEANVEPIHDALYGPRYRASAQLTDGTDLPCVVFQSKRRLVDLALRRFEELKPTPSQHRNVVGSFVATGGNVDFYQLKHIALSPFAWPQSMLKTIHGETSMGWTAFVVEMNDGRFFSYGTSFNFEFFDLPKGCTYLDIKRIHSAVVYVEGAGIQPFALGHIQDISCFRERPFFTCYLDEIDPHGAKRDVRTSSKRSRWRAMFGSKGDQT